MFFMYVVLRKNIRTSEIILEYLYMLLYMHFHMLFNFKKGIFGYLFMYASLIYKNSFLTIL